MKPIRRFSAGTSVMSSPPMMRRPPSSGVSNPAMMRKERRLPAARGPEEHRAAAAFERQREGLEHQRVAVVLEMFRSSIATDSVMSFSVNSVQSSVVCRRALVMRAAEALFAPLFRHPAADPLREALHEGEERHQNDEEEERVRAPPLRGASTRRRPPSRRGSVRVSGVWSIQLMLNSPRETVVTISPPAMIPGIATGTTTRMKVVKGDAPSVAEASSYAAIGSTRSTATTLLHHEGRQNITCPHRMKRLLWRNSPQPPQIRRMPRPIAGPESRGRMSASSRRPAQRRRSSRTSTQAQGTPIRIVITSVPERDPEASDDRVAVELQHLRDPVRRPPGLGAAEGVLHEGRQHHLHDGRKKKERQAGDDRLRDRDRGPMEFLLRLHGLLLRRRARSSGARDQDITHVIAPSTTESIEAAAMLAESVNSV